MRVFLNHISCRSTYLKKNVLKGKQPMGHNNINHYQEIVKWYGDNKLDVLAWWKANHKIFFVLFVVTRDITLKDVFSEGRYILDDRWSNLHPHIIEMIMRIKRLGESWVQIT